MERGGVEGATGSIEGAYGASYYEVVKYFIEPGAYGGDYWMVMNLDKFNSLPAHLQKLLAELPVEMEAEIEELTMQVMGEAHQGLIDNGHRTEDEKEYVVFYKGPRWKLAPGKGGWFSTDVIPLLDTHGKGTTGPLKFKYKGKVYQSKHFFTMPALATWKMEIHPHNTRGAKYKGLPGIRLAQPWIEHKSRPVWPATPL